MSDYRVACVGTGPDPDDPEWGVSAAMAYRHADAYRASDACELVACADLIRERAEAFADTYGVAAGGVYEDYGRMIEEREPEVVSVCTPVPTHADIVSNCAEYDSIRAIHCEKPMADAFGECRSMAAACERNGVALTFNHQRRFSDAYLTARERIESGEIGEIERFEIGGKNLFDFGSHLIDVCNGLNGECRPEWTLCQVDYRDENVRYGSHNENQALAQCRYENGVDALLSTGVGAETVGASVRVRGTDGVLELWADGGRTPLRVRPSGAESAEAVACPQETPMIRRAIDDVVDALDSDRSSELAAERALNATRIIFGCWESARRRGRVSFPLDIEDNPLEAMVEAGDLTPTQTDDGA